MSSNVVSFDEYRTKEAVPPRLSIQKRTIFLNKAGFYEAKEKLGDPERLSFEADPDAGVIYIRPAGEDGDYKFSDRKDQINYGLSFGSEVIRDSFLDIFDELEMDDVPMRAELNYWKDEDALVAMVENFEPTFSDNGSQSDEGTTTNGSGQKSTRDDVTEANDGEMEHSEGVSDENGETDPPGDQDLPQHSEGAEELGREAARQDKDKDENPYDLGKASEDHLYFAWKDGWEDEHDDA